MLFRDVLAANVVLGLVRLLGQLPSGGALRQQVRGIIRTGLLTAWVPLRSAGVVQGCPGGHCSIGPGLSHRLLGQPPAGGALRQQEAGIILGITLLAP